METTITGSMGGCQNYGSLNIRCRIIIGIQRGTIILTTTHMCFSNYSIQAYMEIIRQWISVI